MIIFEDEEYRLWDAHSHWSRMISRILKPILKYLATYELMDFAFSTLKEIKKTAKSKFESKLWLCMSVLDYYHIDRTINLPVFGFDRKISYELQNKYPERVIGFGNVSPNSKNLEEDLHNLVKNNAWGIKLHPHMMKFRFDKQSESVGRIFEFCQENHIIILSHTGSHSEIKNIVPILKNYPNLGFILGHSGLQPQINDAIKAARECPNAYLEISGNPYTYKLLEAIKDRDIGVERILFGTDIPSLNPRVEIQKILALSISSEEKRMIFSKNLEVLLKKFLGDKYNN